MELSTIFVDNSMSQETTSPFFVRICTFLVFCARQSIFPFYRAAQRVIHIPLCERSMKTTFPQFLWKSYPHFPQPERHILTIVTFPHTLWKSYPHFPQRALPKEVIHKNCGKVIHTFHNI